MTITIGGNTFNTRKPRDLDEIVIDSTGYSTAELARAVAAGAPAHLAARALHPFLGADAPSIAELAQMIAQWGAPDLAVQISDLLGGAADAEGGE